ncbi:hypothetical protein KP509_01G032600 [Ceratopteris richardii]|uniref:Uncharacterized protein n=1 Tax=Ceratopteris richardii TaxID=49495 RepID=A0A8T2VNJ5_CERRI|nr:hypothetical protein KP509_01G032600 [Ceratopteris richardii]
MTAASPPADPPITLYFSCCLFIRDEYKSTTTRVRRPAQTASEGYIAKINKAYELMKALPETDRRSSEAQANLAALSIASVTVK